MWSNAECTKYYLCLDKEVFEFKCSVGLLFDVVRQICDFKQNVDNCDITAGELSPPAITLLPLQLVVIATWARRLNACHTSIWRLTNRGSYSPGMLRLATGSCNYVSNSSDASLILMKLSRAWHCCRYTSKLFPGFWYLCCLPISSLRLETHVHTMTYIFLEVRAPKPLLEAAQCPESNQLGCADGTCLPNEYFCDGSVDCPDGSDEVNCTL